MYKSQRGISKIHRIYILKVFVKGFWNKIQKVPLKWRATTKVVKPKQNSRRGLTRVVEVLRNRWSGYEMSVKNVTSRNKGAVQMEFMSDLENT